MISLILFHDFTLISLILLFAYVIEISGKHSHGTTVFKQAGHQRHENWGEGGDRERVRISERRNSETV